MYPTLLCTPRFCVPEPTDLQYINLLKWVIGFGEGSIMVKIGREDPVVSVDNSRKIMWSKHNEIQHIKSVGVDNEVCI